MLTEPKGSVKYGKIRCYYNTNYKHCAIHVSTTLKCVTITQFGHKITLWKQDSRQCITNTTKSDLNAKEKMLLDTCVKTTQ